ncbi:MAG TPA: CDP-diacylglycerol--glycerol-3-phosphate 3-phosphatidyltransferase [bacterium]|nr:CDP-diacylglycerol--glycerol-3-phosphate 3-phosphatidyltransferase [bacterium]
MTLPNRLTLVRIALAPLFVVAVAVGHFYAYLAALVLLALAALTDLADGRIARKTGTRSAFGEFADPLADKLFVVTALVSFAAVDAVPWWLALIVVWRELIVTTLRAYAAHRGVDIPPSRLGKAKTLLQMIAVLAVLAYLTARAGFPVLGWEWNEILDRVCRIIYLAILGLSVAQTLLSGAQYLWNARKLLRSGVEGEEGG